ncbi:hypothetical protein J6590_060380 [Homalodisca vitripennis]|nr:hypothetical protein J6590_060380 [Homalodisca vitripennis]
MTRKHLENLREKNRAANCRFHLAIEKQAIYRRMTEMYRYTAAKESRPQATQLGNIVERTLDLQTHPGHSTMGGKEARSARRFCPDIEETEQHTGIILMRQVTCVAGFPLCRGLLHVLSREHRWSYTPERGHLELCEVLCPNCTASEKRSIFAALTIFPSDEESPSGVTSQA